MLTSILLILFFGSLFGLFFQKLRLPSLVGMLLSGILLGPSLFNLLSPTFLDYSSSLRTIALFIIITRSALSLDLSIIKQTGRPAILLCFLPALLEILLVTMIAPLLFSISYLDAAILGCVLAAVSPAIIVPRMIHLLQSNYKPRIPTIILAGATLDDLFVLLLFTTLTLSSQSSLLFILFTLFNSLVLGLLTGFILTKLHSFLPSKGIFIFLLTLSVLLYSLESILPLSSLFSLFIGILYYKHYHPILELSTIYKKLWSIAEIFLFVLVGASLDLSLLPSISTMSILLLVLTLLLRLCSIYLCFIKSSIPFKERLFTMFALTPKATVQAAIGGIPLALGMGSGSLILGISILSILFSAPLGALAIDLSYKHLLQKENNP